MACSPIDTGPPLLICRPTADVRRLRSCAALQAGSASCVSGVEALHELADPASHPATRQVPAWLSHPWASVGAAAGPPGLLPPSSSAPAMDLDYHPVPASKQPSMREIAARHWTEYAGLVVLIVLLVRRQAGRRGWRKRGRCCRDHQPRRLVTVPCRRWPSAFRLLLLL